MNNNNSEHAMFSTETIMAFVDGELTPAKRREFEEALRNDAELSSAVENYRRNDLQLTNILSVATENSLPHIQIPDIPMPAPVPSKKPSGIINWFTTWSSSAIPDWLFRPSLAFYTIAVLGFGIVIGNTFPLFGKSYISSNDIFEQSQVVSAAINMALERELSGKRYNYTSTHTNSKGGVTPIKTWINKDGQYCREFKLEISSTGNSSSLTATACRVSSGYWKPHPPIDHLLLST